MFFLYNISIHIYLWLIHLASVFNSKARRWKQGRKNIFHELAIDFKDHPRVLWFHAASLGEFEQGRPVIEAFRKRNPEIKILFMSGFVCPSIAHQGIPKSEYAFVQKPFAPNVLVKKIRKVLSGPNGLKELEGSLPD